MKTLKTLVRSSLLLCLIVVASCDHWCPHHDVCRISKFYWEGKWHQAYYSTSGRLVRLEATDSKVLFYYDGADKLTHAEIYTTNPAPQYKFEYIQGPSGIIKSTITGPGGFVRTVDFHYVSPSQVDYYVDSEFGGAPGDPATFVITKYISYSGGNVTLVDGLVNGNPFTKYFGQKYDKKNNPFRELANAVGNPAFFPACNFVSFPVADYDISILSIFSKNNPKKSRYDVGGGAIIQDQTFDYIYNGDAVKSIAWTDLYISTTKNYAFEYNCSFGSDED
ncbi:MAG TPA: hypothetical protein VIN08_08395 [Ohtaekwangia sp.]|uniref:hypothetical protein n=1 Tax=Ohtaekwangia sp. TaxID=2066019 RepID=UPI002F91F84A